MIWLLLVAGTASCSRISVSQAEIGIQEYLNQEHQGRFKVDSIEKNYSKDLFHQQTGFKAWLTDNSGVQFGPIYFQKNKSLRKWITYMGSGIEELYRLEVQKQKTNRR
jgi:hypothetical protein